MSWSLPLNNQYQIARGKHTLIVSRNPRKDRIDDTLPAVLPAILIRNRVDKLIQRYILFSAPVYSALFASTASSPACLVRGVASNGAALLKL
jgi:hypothetical protein